MLNTLDYVTFCIHARGENEVYREAMILSWLKNYFLIPTPVYMSWQNPS